MKRFALALCLFLLAMPAVAQDLNVKIYIAPQEQVSIPGTPFVAWRSVLNNYVNVQTGETFDEIDNPARRYSICVVKAQPATFAAIDADPAIVALTPNDVTPAQLAAQLDGLVSSLPSAFKTKIQTELEARGISFAWVGAGNTVRDVLRYLLRIHFFAQRTEGEGNMNVFNFVKENLDTKVNQVSVTIRNAVSAWMEGKGLSTGWITGQTTVRQILHSIVTDLGFGVIHIGGQGF